MKTPVPSALADALLREIAAAGWKRHFPSNTVLIHEGDRSDTLFIVLSGRVKVYGTNAGGREVTLRTHCAGEYIGELALDGGGRSASVMTLEPTVCAVVPGSRFREFLASHPDFATHLILDLIGRVRQLTEQVKSLALDDVYQRIAALFQQLAVQDGQIAAIPEKLTQQDIADRVGASREMVSRIIKQLVVGGYIEIHGRQIVLKRQLPQDW